ncbi:metal-dependent hydrolase [Urechidicola sp. KH5]
MDSLTQIVLGAAVGEAVLGKKVGNKALLYGAIAGTIPDLDVIFGNLTDTVTAIEWHRGFSHSILFCLLLSPLLGWLVNTIEPKYNLGWKPWAKLFFWGLFTHPILDAFTTWGTQLFWPFDVRLAFNSIFVIDPLYTVPFLGCTILVLFQKRDSKKRTRLNRFGLIVSTFYLLFTVLLKTIVTSQFKEQLKHQNINYTAISTRPSPMNTILWNANIDTKEAYLIADYSFFDKNPIQFKRYPKNPELYSDVLKHEEVQRLIRISNSWYIIEKNGRDWVFNDLRFGLIPRKDGTSFFAFSYQLNIVGNKLEVKEVPKTRGDAKFLLQNLWKRIKGNESN